MVEKNLNEDLSSFLEDIEQIEEQADIIDLALSDTLPVLLELEKEPVALKKEATLPLPPIIDLPIPSGRHSQLTELDYQSSGHTGFQQAGDYIEYGKEEDPVFKAWLKSTYPKNMKDVLVWVQSSSGGGGVTDHGALTGLGDDDHTQYLLANGTRAITKIDVTTSGVFSGDVRTDGAFYGDGSNLTGMRKEFIFVLDGGGSALTTGDKQVYTRVPADFTLEGWQVVGDQSGVLYADIWKCPYGDFPPTVADSITGGSDVYMSGTISNQDTTLAGWTTTFTEGDYLNLNVDAASTVTKAVVTLYGRV